MVINYEENTDNYYENTRDIAKVQEIRKIIDEQITKMAEQLSIRKLESWEKFKGSINMPEKWTGFLEENSEEIFKVLIKEWAANGWELALWNREIGGSLGMLYISGDINYSLSKRRMDEKEKTLPTIIIQDTDE